MRLTAETLMKIILLVVVLIIIIVVIKSIRDVTVESTSDQECWDSIRQHAAASSLTDKDVKEPIKCPIKTETIDKNKKDTEVRKIIADDMAECWRTWGNGELDLFTNKGIYCHVCYVVQFEDKNRKIYNLEEYLLTHSPKYSSTSYYDYLTPFSTESTGKIDKDYQFQEDYPPIDTSQDYAIIFTYAKGLTAIENLVAGNRAELLTASGFTLMVGGMGIGAGAAVVAIPFLSTPAGWAIIGVGTVSLGISAIMAKLGFSNEEPEWMSATILTPYTVEKIQEIGCETMPASPR